MNHTNHIADGRPVEVDLKAFDSTFSPLEITYHIRVDDGYCTKWHAFNSHSSIEDCLHSHSYGFPHKVDVYALSFYLCTIDLSIVLNQFSETEEHSDKLRVYSEFIDKLWLIREGDKTNRSRGVS